MSFNVGITECCRALLFTINNHVAISALKDRRLDGAVAWCALHTWVTVTLWLGGVADKAIIRGGGKIFSEMPLSRNQIISVPGPLGISRIVIHNRQVRISADPSPRQYCVRQGWLKQAGEIAISQHLPARWFGPVTHSIFDAFAHITGQLFLVYFWLIPHTGLVYLIPIFATAALLFGKVNGLIATHYLDAPNTELEAPKLTG